MSDIEDEEESFCPLCVEEMDLSDRNFLPCPCGYRVCMWCWHHIRENLNGLCPACRTPYNADPHAFSAVDRHEIVKKNKERKQKEKQERKTTDRPAVSVNVQSSALTTKSAATPNSIVDRRLLHNYRVVQRNLVYVIGVPVYLANEDLLRKAEYFGQYGKIGKVVIHKNHTSTSHATVSAYVTFVYKEDAKASIQSLDGYYMDGHVLRASFGTTKYCNNFIRGIACNNPDCVYLHDLGDDDDRFTKEEIQAGYSKLPQVAGKDQSIVTGNGGPSGTGKRPVGEPVLPPPVFIQDNIPSGANNNSSSNGTSSTKGSIPRTATWSSSISDTASASSSGSYSAAASTTTASGVGAASASPPTTTLSTPAAPVSSFPDASTFVKDSSAKTTNAPSELHSAQSMPVNRTKEVSGGSVASSNNSNISSKYSASAEETSKIPNKSIASNPSDVAISIPSANNSESNKNQAEKVVSTVADVKTQPSTVKKPSAAVSASYNSDAKPDGKPLPPQSTSSQTAAALALASMKSGSFNGISRSAVFPVPISSLTISVWSAILQPSTSPATFGDLNVNPFGDLIAPLSELLELTLPPVDAICMRPWPKPHAHYYRTAESLTIAVASTERQPQNTAATTASPSLDADDTSSQIPTQSANDSSKLSTQQQQQQQQQQQLKQSPQEASEISSAAAKKVLPSAAGNPNPAATSTTPNISALRQIFPGVNIAPAIKK